MHKEFYASGFIYHPSSQQILLHQLPGQSTTQPLWSLFGETYRGDEPSEKAFHRALTEKLGLDIPAAQCFFVYDYLHKETKQNHFIHYAVIEKMPEEEEILTDGVTGWFYFKQIAKLPMHPQTKQDIIVGQRVINLAIREIEQLLEANSTNNS